MILRFTRSVFTLLKSRRTADQIALGAALGLLIGLTPIDGHTFLILAVAMIIHCSFRATVVMGLISAPFGHLLAAPSYKLGIWLLEGSGAARSLAAWLNEFPLLGISRFDRYWMFGSAVVALVAAAAFYYPIRLLVKKYRTRWAPGLNEAGWYKKIHEYRVVRWFHWLFLGATGAIEEVKKKPVWSPAKYFRLPGIAALFIIIILLTGGMWALGETLVTSAMAATLGVTVEVKSVEFNPFTRNLKIEELSIPDKTRKGENLVQFGSFETRLSVVALLSGRLYIDHLRLSDGRFHVRRNEDGSLNLETVDPKSNEHWQTAWKDWLAWVSDHGQEADWAETIKKGHEYWDRALKLGRADPRTLPFDASAAADVPPRSARVKIGEIALINMDLAVIDEIQPDVPLPRLNRVDLIIRNIEFPKRSDQPFTTELTASMTSSMASRLKANGEVYPSRQSWTLSLEELPLRDLRELFVAGTGLAVEEGSARAQSRLAIGEIALKGEAQLCLTDLRVSAEPDVSLFGVDPALTPHIVDGINAYAKRMPIVFAFTIRGTRSDPEFDWDVPWLQIARAGLEWLGVRWAADRLGKEIERLSPEHIIKELTGEFETIQQSAIDALRIADPSAIKNLPDTIKEDIEEKVKGVIKKIFPFDNP